MAQRTIVVLEDDLAADGTEADETVVFGLDGTSYEIDLTAENAAALRDALAEWVANARKSGRSSTRGASAPRRAKASARGGRAETDVADVRSWGAANGFQVSSRGRISRDLQEAYDLAH